MSTTNWPGAADLEAALERLLDAIDQGRGPDVAAALAEVDRLAANLDRTVPARFEAGVLLGDAGQPYEGRAHSVCAPSSTCGGLAGPGPGLAAPGTPLPAGR